MVIDDHVAINELVAALVDSMPGCRMHGSAHTEEEALALCSREQPDVIILDLVLPRTSGLVLLGKLKAVCEGARVMVFSGNLTAEMLRRALAAGVLGIVGKMSSLAEFRQALQAVARGRTFFSREVSDLVKELVVHPQPPSGAEGAGLSERERTVLEGVAQGLSSHQIATQLGVSVHTVANHRSRLMKKTGLHKAAQLSVFAADLGLLAARSMPAGPTHRHEPESS